MDKVIRELTQAVIKSRNVATLTRALKKVKPSNDKDRTFAETGKPNVAKLPRTSNNLSERTSNNLLERTSNNRLRNSFRTLRSLSRGSKGVDLMRDLWKQTGMKTNGRKLLVDTLVTSENVQNKNVESEMERYRSRRRRRKRACKIHRKVHGKNVFKGGLPFAKMSAQIAAIYVCICILCPESVPNFQLENILNCMHMHANMQQKCKHENYFSFNYIIFVSN
jgi:hypothetical protein